MTKRYLILHNPMTPIRGREVFSEAWHALAITEGELAALDPSLLGDTTRDDQWADHVLSTYAAKFSLPDYPPSLMVSQWATLAKLRGELLLVPESHHFGRTESELRRYERRLLHGLYRSRRRQGQRWGRLARRGGAGRNTFRNGRKQ